MTAYSCLELDYSDTVSSPIANISTIAAAACFPKSWSGLW